MNDLCVARSPRVVQSRLADGEAVLLHLETGQYHELNPVGAAIWDLLEEPRTVDEISCELRNRVEDPPDDLREIVAEFLDRLKERGLIT